MNAKALFDSEFNKDEHRDEWVQTFDKWRDDMISFAEAYAKQQAEVPTDDKVQIGESFSSDFKEDTWTFEMGKDFSVTAGHFAIVPLDHYKKQSAEQQKRIEYLEHIEKMYDEDH